MAAMRQRIQICCIAIGLFCALFAATALQQNLTVRRYTVSNEKLQGSIHIALLTDLHSVYYGSDQKVLLDAVAAAQPDLVFLVGDIVDDVAPCDGAEALLEALGARYQCYYVSGNHEFWSKNIDKIKRKIRDCGITVLEGEQKKICLDGQNITICGVDDPEINAYTSDPDAWRTQLFRCAESVNETDFTILLSHRPEYAELYGMLGFDLTLCGHAHGGQVRIPGVLNGLLAPNQGFFPAYAGGEYLVGEENKQTMIVSRGLVRNFLPRIFNPPELVVIKL